MQQNAALCLDQLLRWSARPIRLRDARSKYGGRDCADEDLFEYERVLIELGEGSSGAKGAAKLTGLAASGSIMVTAVAILYGMLMMARGLRIRTELSGTKNAIRTQDKRQSVGKRRRHVPDRHDHTQCQTRVDDPYDMAPGQYAFYLDHDEENLF
jgi:hypothetical protein